MAGGRGTRMRSAVPKHLHPILGRRMVDWVVEAARPLGADPLVVVASPDTADAFDGPDGRRPGASRSAPATRSARRATRVGDADEVLVLSGDTPLLTTALLEALVEHAPARARPARPSSRSSPPTSAATAASSATPTATSRRSSRPPTRRRSSSRSARRTRRSTSSAATCSGPRSSGSQPANAQGELYLTDAVRDLVDAGHSASPSTSRPTRHETEGVNTRVELAAAAATLRDRINDGAHARRASPSSTPRRRGSSRASTLEPRTSSCTRSPCSAERPRVADRRRDRPARRRGRRRDRRAAPWSARSVTFAREPCSGRERRPARSSS